ncbi:hypothetical protein E3Q06_01941 [Wallemia mellicola]|nr:hypothetical protein E3Q21_00983 [Wallemia mellicola]TIB91142.1 hypothetical protein E3Q20_00970 [Wallemia mellicola]TIC40627.1 hypothetical protein E3Q07_02020 [Wallemia mellicola]TIC49180.1 hypothetical protein E3Q06_01941 [Wallemia mellicola]TIC55335.1 hypothetical protein E3Q04_01654 [Wallemia mellicola]
MQPSNQKPKTLTLDAWESKSPLNLSGKKSLAVINNASAEFTRPYPDSFAKPLANKAPTSYLSTPLEASTPQPQTTATATKTINPNQLITTPQQFFEWFEQIEKSIDEEHESKYQVHLNKLNQDLDLYGEILEKVNHLENEINRMRNEWQTIDDGTDSLKSACQKYMDERDDLIALKERLEEPESQEE